MRLIEHYDSREAAVTVECKSDTHEPKNWLRCGACAVADTRHFGRVKGPNLVGRAIPVPHTHSILPFKVCPLRDVYAVFPHPVAVLTQLARPLGVIPLQWPQLLAVRTSMTRPAPSG